MNKKEQRRKQLLEQIKVEDEKGAQFLEKFKQIKKKNTESKKRTKINSHKMEWIK